MIWESVGSEPTRISWRIGRFLKHVKFAEFFEIPTFPIGSMYGMFTYIYHNVGKYTIHGSYGFVSILPLFELLVRCLEKAPINMFPNGGLMVVHGRSKKSPNKNIQGLEEGRIYCH